MAWVCHTRFIRTLKKLNGNVERLRPPSGEPLGTPQSQCSMMLHPGILRTGKKSAIQAESQESEARDPTIGLSLQQQRLPLVNYGLFRR